MNNEYVRNQQQVLKALDFNIRYVDHCLFSTVHLKNTFKKEQYALPPKIIISDGACIDLKQYFNHFLSDRGEADHIASYIAKHIFCGVARQCEYAQDYYTDSGQWDTKRSTPMYLVAQAVRHAAHHAMKWQIDALYTHNENEFPLSYRNIIIKKSDIGQRVVTEGQEIPSYYQLLFDILNDIKESE